MASFKDQGNEEFKKENYLKAAALYTQAIKEDPGNAVLYSNRSAALAKLNKVTKAMEDADKCISLRPDWEKGYFRKAAVLEIQENMQEALEVYQTAAKLCADNKELSNKIRTMQKLLKIKPNPAAASPKKAAAPAAPAENGVPPEPLEAALAMALAPTGDVPLAEWCRDMAAEALGSIAESGTDFAPSVHFLPGPGAEAHSEEEAHIRASYAFTAPDVYGAFVGQMRGGGQRLDARAAFAIVPKAAVSFPQVWERPGWPANAGKKAGVFVQLEAKAPVGRLAWFVPVTNNTAGKAIRVGPQDYAPLPALLK